MTERVFFIDYDKRHRAENFRQLCRIDSKWLVAITQFFDRDEFEVICRPSAPHDLEDGAAMDSAQAGQDFGAAMAEFQRRVTR